MNRDMDLIRRIVLATSDLAPRQELSCLDGVTPEEFAAHAVWLEEAGLIKARITTFISGEPPDVEIERLTWDGCEFADSVRSETLWKKAKEQVIKPSASFSFGVLRDWLKAEIQQGFPTLRSVGN